MIDNVFHHIVMHTFTWNATFKLVIGDKNKLHKLHDKPARRYNNICNDETQLRLTIIPNMTEQNL